MNIVGSELRQDNDVRTFASMSGMLDLSRDSKAACLPKLNVLTQSGEFVKGIVS